ncbi:MAG TPA: EamA family transporter [Bacillales bacterium]|nr:EamA family transporter [Bacillales bacterium]
MSLVALVLILLSAFMHATWNYYSKRAQGGVAFTWLFMAISTVIYAPFAILVILYQHSHFDWIDGLFIAGSTVIHLIYFLVLQKGYKVGDLSVVYPVARGTGPMLAAIAAIFIYNEQPSFIEFLGVFLIVLSVFFLTGGVKVLKNSASFLPLMYGLIVGVIIASYTLLDKGSVSVLLIPPLLYNYGSILGQFILLSPLAAQRRQEIRHEWKVHRKEAFMIAVLSPLAYILVLTAMIFTPVSHVAPVRELSILIGTFMGTRLLAEGFGKQRIAAAGAMVAGVIFVALS